MPREAAVTLRSFVDLLDVADEFCRQQRLLTLARTPEQRVFQRWFLGEYIRQAAGASPEPWVEPTPESEPVSEPVSQPVSEPEAGELHAVP
jgi:hypothetical protein